MPARIASVVIVACIALAPTRSARAQRLGFLRASDPSAVAIAREDIELRCTPSGERELDCAIVARWTLSNDSDDPIGPELTLSWSGDPTDVELRVGEAVLATEIPRSRTVRVLVAPRATSVVELRATQRLAGYVGWSPTSEQPSLLDPHDPLSARHPLLATRWEVVRRGLAWARPSDIHWSSIGPTTFRVHPIEGWEIAPHADRSLADRTDGDGARVVVWEPSESDGSTSSFVGIELTRGIHTDLLRHGGPFIALGGTFDRGFRGRVGYELGIGELVLLEVALDSDFQQQVVIAPLVEIASYSLLLLPSLSLGAGVPIQVAPDVRAGVRFEASATFYSLAFVASIDVWPVDGTWQLSLLGRAGL